MLITGLNDIFRTTSHRRIKISVIVLSSAFLIFFYGISINTAQSYPTLATEGSPRIDDDDVNNGKFSEKREKLEIEVIQPLLLYVYDGEVTDFRITLKNISKEKTYRIDILEDNSRNPNTPLIFYSPHKQIILEPGKSITLNCRVSAVLKQKNPIELKSTLDLKIVITNGEQIPLQIPVEVCVPDFKIIKAIVENEENQVIIVTIKNIGKKDLTDQSEFIANINSHSLKTIFKKIKAGKIFELKFAIPDKFKIEKNSRLKLIIKRKKPPLHTWELPEYPIGDDKSWGSIVFIAILFILIIILTYYFTIRTFDEENTVEKQLSKNPENLMYMSPRLLVVVQNLLNDSPKLETAFAAISVSKSRLDNVILFYYDWNSEERCKYLVECLEASSEPVTKDHIHLYKLKMIGNFMLNMDQCLLAFPLGDIPANEVISHIKKIEGAFYQVCLFITFNEQQQAEIRKTSLNLDNLFVTPQSKELTHLLLSPYPLDVFARLIASQVKVTRISPYQTKGGVKKESVFFGRVQLLTHIMQREPANYLLVGGRQLGKSSLLKAIERRYNDDPNIECHYLHLQSSEITSLLAGSLDLPGDTNLQELLKHLRQSPGGKYRLFLIDEADQFIASESQTGCTILKHFRSLSEEGKCYFIFAGFWNLYHAATFDYQSPIKNFGEILTIEALEPDACRQLATKPMSLLNIHYESDELVEILLRETGQRPNLIAIICNEMLKKLDMTQRLIHRENLEEAMDSNEVRSSLSGWERLTPDETTNRLDRIIVYSTIDLQTFTQAKLMQILDSHGCTYEPEAVKQSLARLELAFILKRQKQGYLYCVPLFKKMIQQQDPEDLLKRELKALKGR